MLEARALTLLSFFLDREPSEADRGRRGRMAANYQALAHAPMRSILSHSDEGM
jgi:hypothetical protein